MPSSPSSHASCSINQHILPVLRPKYISHLFLFTSLLYYLHPSHYHILSGLFSQPTKCDPCYLCFCFYLASFSSFLTQQFHKVKAHLISLSNLKLLDWFPDSLSCPASPPSFYLVAHLLSLLQSNPPPFSSWNYLSSSMIELFCLCYSFCPECSLPLYLFVCMAESSFRCQFVTSEKYSLILSAVSPLPENLLLLLLVYLFSFSTCSLIHISLIYILHMGRQSFSFTCFCLNTLHNAWQVVSKTTIFQINIF